MADDISKVVRRFRGVGELEREGYIPAGSAAERESATTPAEVGPESFDFGGVSYVRATDHQQRIATLARQLAEANSELAMHRVDATRVAACPWRVQKGHTSECQPPKRLQDALDQLAEATRRLGEVEKEAATERALQRAAKELPKGWDVCVYVEQGSGWVELRNPDLDTVEFDRDDYSLAEQIESATDAALQKEPE